MFEDVSGFVGTILVIVCFIVVEVIYHSLFETIYFGNNGCVTEIIICIFIAVILASIIIKIWYIAVIIIVIVLAAGYFIKKKKE